MPITLWRMACGSFRPYRKPGADFILTTEKDAVKLSPLLSKAPLRVLRVVMKIDDEMNLAGLIEKKVFSC